jgi:hypothetical protein
LRLRSDVALVPEAYRWASLPHHGVRMVVRRSGVSEREPKPIRPNKCCAEGKCQATLICNVARIPVGGDGGVSGPEAVE